VAQQVALILSPGGEFALVLIGAALAANIVPASAGSMAMVAATLSMFAIPLMVRLSEKIAGRRRDEDADLAALAPTMVDGPARAIIVGYGRVGDLVGQLLTGHNITYLAIDTDPALVARERNRGKVIYYGDATKPELLRRCGIVSAPALIVTMDNPSAVELVVTVARAERPDMPIVARARDAEHAAKLYDLDVTDAVPETIEASLQLSEAVLVSLGIPMGRVIASVHEKRDEFRRVLQGSSKDGRERRAIHRSMRRNEEDLV
jgi:CPA2 family monovalent cation:H+ antiporter-2